MDIYFIAILFTEIYICLNFDSFTLWISVGIKNAPELS